MNWCHLFSFTTKISSYNDRLNATSVFGLLFYWLLVAADWRRANSLIVVHCGDSVVTNWPNSKEYNSGTCTELQSRQGLPIVSCYCKVACLTPLTSGHLKRSLINGELALELQVTWLIQVAQTTITIDVNELCGTRGGTLVTEPPYNRPITDCQQCAGRQTRHVTPCSLSGLVCWRLTAQTSDSLLRERLPVDTPDYDIDPINL